MGAQAVAQVISVVAGATAAREQAISTKRQARAVKRARGQQNEKRAKLESEKQAKAEDEALRRKRDKQKAAKSARSLSEQGRKGTILTGPQGTSGTTQSTGQQSTGPETKTLLGL